MSKIITYTNGRITETDIFDTLQDALTALDIIGRHLGTFTGATVDDTIIMYYDDYSGDKITLEVVDG